MNLKDKKFIPYYLLGVIIICLSATAVILIGTSFSNNGENESSAETTTLFMNGEVPFYPDIPASSFNKDSFVFSEEGRMVYNDSDIAYTTGIDVSSHQGEIDWKKVAADGIDFAILRGGYRGYGQEGLIREDSLFRLNANEADKAGIKLGVYFYSQAITPEEAEEEADFLIEIIKEYNITYPVVYDWENETGIGMRTDNLSGEIITECAVTFCERIKAAGYTPAIYFNLTDAYRRYNLDKIKNYVFWYAQHEGDSPAFYYNYSIWQYSDSGKAAGVNGNVDLNICFLPY